MQGLGFRVLGFGFRVLGFGFRVWGLGLFRIQGFRGLGLAVLPLACGEAVARHL